jgi:hypothetical protein
MKWTLKLERIDEAGNLHSTTVAYVERPELTSEADLGLIHDCREPSWPDNALSGKSII